MNQREMIYQYMNEHGSITDAEAREYASCSRLSARIWDLIHIDGYNIGSKTIKGTNKFGKKFSCASYYIIGEENGDGI